MQKACCIKGKQDEEKVQIIFSEGGIFIFPVSHRTYRYQKKSKLVKYMRHPTLRSTMMVRSLCLPSQTFSTLLCPVCDQEVRVLWIVSPGLHCLLASSVCDEGKPPAGSQKAGGERGQNVSLLLPPPVQGLYLWQILCLSKLLDLILQSHSPSSVSSSHWEFRVLSPPLIPSYLWILRAPCCCQALGT